MRQAAKKMELPVSGVAITPKGVDSYLKEYAAHEIEPTYKRLFESVASLQGINIDTVSVFPYFSGPKFIKEGDHVGAGRVSSRLY